MMRRRYEAYKDLVVRPFFRDHFSRLDRQIVLVDTLAAFNAGPEALYDLEAALAGILDCFRVGRSTFLSTLLRPRIDRILFAATKADHLHHTSHDRLEAILRRLVERAASRAEVAGAAIDVVALSAVRATREAQVQRGREKLPSILGTPLAGELANGEAFDGNTEVATFPGDLPTDLDGLFSGDGAIPRAVDVGGGPGRFPLSALSAPATPQRRNRRSGSASYPPRPRASVPDRRPTAMSERSGQRRPVTFKLDDPHVVILDPDEAAGRPARGSIRVTPEAEPEPEPVLLPESSEKLPVPVRKGLRWGAAVLVVSGRGSSYSVPCAGL